MVKKIKNVAILCLFVSNLSLAVKYRFSALNIVALLLSGVVLIWDIFDRIYEGRQKRGENID